MEFEHNHLEVFILNIILIKAVEVVMANGVLWLGAGVIVDRYCL